MINLTLTVEHVPEGAKLEVVLVRGDGYERVVHRVEAVDPSEHHPAKSLVLLEGAELILRNVEV